MPDTPTLQVSQEVRAQMARKRYTQSDIADALGLTQTAISNRLSGKTPWDINELSVTADLLGVPLTRLLPTKAGEQAAS